MSANVAIDKVERHPVSSNKLRVTFNEAVTTATAETIGNYSFSPSLTVQWAAMVSGSGNTQVDLHFGTAPGSDVNTVGLWLNDDASHLNMVDSGPNGYDLAFVGTSPVASAVEPNGLLKRSKRKLIDAGGAGSYSYFRTGTDFQTVLQGEFTLQIFQAALNPIGNHASMTSLWWEYTISGGARFRIEPQPSTALLGSLYTPWRYFQISWWDGSNHQYLAQYNAIFDNTGWTQFDLSKPHILTIRKRGSGSSKITLEVFYNKHLVFVGQEWGNWSTQVGTHSLLMGGEENNPMMEYLDFVNWRSEAMSDAAIAAVVDNALFPIPQNTYTLTVSNVAALSGGELIVAPRDTAKISLVTPTAAVSSEAVTGTVIRGQRLPELTWYAMRHGVSTVRLQFARPLHSSASALSTSNYGVAGPSTVTVTGVSLTEGNSHIDLTISGTWKPGTYTVTLAEFTVRAATSNDFNTTAPQSFTNVEETTGSGLNVGFN